MKKLFFLMTLLFASMTMFAADVTLSFAGGSGTNQDPISFSDATSGVSAEFTQGTHSSTKPRWDAACVRFYGTATGSNKLTISAATEITSISFAMNGSYTLEKATASVGTLSGTTWTGSAKSVEFTTTAQTRIEGITVTYTPAGGEVAATAIALDKSTLALDLYHAAKLTATLTPADATTAVVWTSSDETVATVSKGVVTALKAGTATIKATAGEGVEATCAVTVNAAPATYTCEYLAGVAVEMPEAITVEGYVTGIYQGWDTEYSNISFYIADATDGGEVFLCFRAKPADGATIAAVGDKVTVNGKVGLYNGKPQLLQGCTYTVAAVVEPLSFELNGGTQDVPADNKALWAEFMEDYNSYLNAGRSPQDLDNCAGNPVAVFITSASWNVDFMIKDDSPQQWLGSYIIAHTANTANPITAESANTAWRGELQGFFLAIDNADNTACGYWGGYGKYNWTEAGQPAAWQPAYQFAHTPVKEGFEFTGWYTDEACTTLATALPESGKVYAGWEAVAPADKYIVAGSAALCGTNWDVNNEANLMTLVDGLYTKVYTNVPVGENYQIKVVKNGTDWFGPEGNYTFNITEACDVTITFNPETKEITATGTGVVIPTELKIDAAYAVGAGAGNWLNGASWDPAAEANKMTAISDKVYQITYADIPAGSYEFKFVVNGTWADSWGAKETISESVENHEAVYNSQDNIKIEYAFAKADIVLTLDLTAFDYTTKKGAKFSVTITEKPVELVSFTVKFQKPADWAKVYIHVWGEGVTATTWPGAELTADAQGWVSYSFENALPSFIFNNGAGVQSADMTGVTEDVCYKWENNGLVVTDCPAEAPAGMKGTYTVGGEGADFASLAEACAAVNAKPIEGDVTLAIAADLTEPTNVGIVNTTAYTITIRPATAEMHTITFTATADNVGPSGSIVIGSSDPVTGKNEVATKNVIIDGCAEGSDVQNLTIVHKNVAGRLVAYGAASDIIIQNIISRHDDASSGARYGVQFRGNTGKPENITVRGNYFDGKHTTQVINFNNGISANIENNTFKLSGLASGQLAYGVHGYTVTGTVNVRGNKFIGVTTADVTTNGIVAVSVQGGTWIVENNYFSGMDYLNTDASAVARMYYVRTIVKNTVIRHNTFYIPELTNKPANTTNTVAAIESAGGGTSIVENNIFVSAESTAQHGFFYGNTNTYKNNVFYMNANNEKAYILGTQTWSDFSAAADNIWSEVAFTDAAKGDLSLAAANDKLLVPAIAEVTTDINGTARGAEKTYAGACEFVASATPQPTEMWLAPNWGEITAGGDMFEVAVNFDVEVSEEQLAENLKIEKSREDIMIMGLNPFSIYVPADAAAGQLMVTVKYGELEAQGAYTILSAGPQGISITPFQDLEIESLGTLQLEAMLYPEDAEAAVVWFSSDETLATVSTTGLVTSLVTAKDTVVRITAAAEGFEGIEAYVDITLLAAKAAAGVTFELNGGTQDVPADNKALWAEFMEDYNSYLNAGRSPQDLDNCASNPVAVFITSASWNVDFMIKDDSPQQWLGSYIIAHTANTANPITAESAHTAWRGELQGFFLAIDNADNTACGYWGGYGKYNWTEAGQPAAWQPAYQFGNAPVKEGYKFTGWYTDAACTTPATALPESGTLYAGWSNETTALENAAVENSNVRKVFENGNVYILRDGVRYTITGIVVE